jgi:hypothetical protein
MITVADSARGSTSALRSHTFLFSAQRAIVDLLTRLMDLIVPSGRFFGPGGLSHSIRATDQSGTYESLDTAAGLCRWAMTHERRAEERRGIARASAARQQGRLQRIARGAWCYRGGSCYSGKASLGQDGRKSEEVAVARQNLAPESCLHRRELQTADCGLYRLALGGWPHVRKDRP